MNFDYLFHNYGLKPLTFKEEWDLPQNVRQTSNNKIKIIDTCDGAIRLIDTIKYRAKGAPELDDDRHAALVQELADKVEAFYKALDDAFRVGY